MLRNVTLMTLFVLSAGAFAADKPAAQARQEMEGEAGGQSTTVTVFERGGRAGSDYSSSENQGTKPAAQARLSMESEAGTQEHYTVVSREEHPIANVGYHRTVRASDETRVYVPSYRSSNTSSKPAAQARLEMERN